VLVIFFFFFFLATQTFETFHLSGENNHRVHHSFLKKRKDGYRYHRGLMERGARKRMWEATTYIRYL
jgi:fatty-acid desaturase